MELIITEKPNSAKKIAEALADGKPAKKSSKERVPYYELTHKNKKIAIVSAVGHVFGLAQKQGTLKSKYPVFDIEWVPSSELNKSSKFTKKYLSTIKRVAKGAKEFTVATDYDIEGEVIGLNVIRYACRQKDSARMKFSTLTKDDLIKAYNEKSKHLDWGQANAGETRHKMDWFFGINLSRALTASIKSTGMFKLMSTGRVQGPALKLIVDKEKEIKAFIPDPYWQIQLTGKVNKGDIVAWHTRDLFWDGKLTKNFILIKEGEYRYYQKEKEIRNEYKNEQEAKNKFLDFIELMKEKGYRETRENEINDKKHVLLIKKNENQIWEKKRANEIYTKCKNEKKAVVSSVEKKQFKSIPPNPFDLTSLQIEAYKCLNISPKSTLEIAQELYTAGYISYPRTSSQQLPKEIGYAKILKRLSKQKEYTKETSFLLKKSSLIPNNGKKTDPAHPAIYPTGIIPELKYDKSKKLYDLITRRFFATFGDAATRETVTVKLDCNKEIFITKGTTTIEKGWFELYGNYVMLKEEELPVINQGDVCNVKKIEMLDKETTPPKRYTEASIIKALEKENLGTKATRASIIERLYNRGFIDGKAIEATELGIRTEETLEKYSPKIVDTGLTRHFEVEMGEIRENKKSPDAVLNEAEKEVRGIINLFDKSLKKIGKELASAHKETRNVMTYVGQCPKCKKGELQIRKGKFGQFIACSGYPKCKTIFSLPQVMVKPTKETCEHCKLPMVMIIKKRKAPQKICINSKCPSKMEVYDKAQLKEMKKIDNGDVEKKCPKCEEGKLVVRKSIYGSFLGCDKYPKCRYTEKLEDNNKADSK